MSFMMIVILLLNQSLIVGRAEKQERERCKLLFSVYLVQEFWLKIT